MNRARCCRIAWLSVFAITALSAGEWAPPPPDPDGFDWIQLDSGEWLKGRLKSMQDDKLEFDSEELDLQTFDWEDVAVIRSPRPVTLHIGRKQEAKGASFVLRETEILLQPDEMTKPTLTIQKADVLGLVSGDSELDLWTIKLSAGATIQSGNSDQIEYNSRLNAKRITAASRFTLDYLGSYSEANGIASENNHRLNTEFDIFQTKRFFYRLPSFEYYRDTFSNIEHRMTLGAGVGYELLDRAKTSWNIAVGPGYQYTIFDSTNESQSDQEGAAALVFISDYEHDLTDRVTFLGSYKGLFSNPESGGSTNHLEARFELELTSRLDLDIGAVYDLTTNPREDKNGNTPSSGDFRFITTLGFEY